ncbi:hypothetical protein CUJ84_pRLN3000142 (plasmid) [Rhizobium leguminosarum]|uniref:Uncharacterized protein n=1 Tax=Rhizobium leguminosarum TaxID=384 RepID=A0A2K9ZGD0_RHILE|nr:hypothetical protein CUJ84_pRLN3000142 [Rhizobium leguminosarum]
MACAHNEWKFGWKAEDASREGRIVTHFKELISTANRATSATQLLEEVSGDGASLSANGCSPARGYHHQ